MIRLRSTNRTNQWRSYACLEPSVVDAIWQSFAAYLPKRERPPTRWAVIALESRTVTASRPSSSAWSPAVRGTWPGGWAREARRPCGAGVTNGWQPEHSSTWWMKRSPLRQGDRLGPVRSVDRRITAQGTDRRRRHRTESHRSWQDRLEVAGCHRHQRRAHRLGHRWCQPARLHPARHPPSTPSSDRGLLVRGSRPCTSTGATTMVLSDRSALSGGSPTS